jgi:two-component sensor histidine kinase
LGQWWWLSGFWLLITLTSVLEKSLSFPADYPQAWRSAAVQWLPWVLLTPALAWLSSVFALRRTSWHRTIWVYAAACALVVGGLGALGYAEESAPPHHRPSPGPREHERHGAPPGLGRGFDRHERERHHDFSRDLGRDSIGNLAFIQLASFQLPIFWAVLAGIHGLRFYEQAKERERREGELESRLAQARLEALRMQLNPHFLFNTLNSIASLVYENPRAADDMIASLSGLLRLTLKAPELQEVSLREEFEFLDQYLRIEQARFGDRLKVERQIEPAALDVLVPTLILQPLAENAIKHGLEKQLAPGVLRITVGRAGDCVRLEVQDNGRGCPPEEREAKKGVGLTNTRARLQQLYGAAARLEIRADGGQGFAVEIHLPWHTDPNPNEHPNFDSR